MSWTRSSLALALVILLPHAPALAAPSEAPAEQATDALLPEALRAPPDDATVSESGLAWQYQDTLELVQGKPQPDSIVKIHFQEWTSDGRLVNSSRKRGKAVMVPLERALPGWREAFTFLEVGDRIWLWVPEQLAYAGKEGKPKGPMIYDIEYLEHHRPPEVPADVAGPPDDATQTSSGLWFKVLKKGDLSPGTPGPSDNVTIDYTGWTTDGKRFDSSVVRGKPATLPLHKAIPGWREAIQLMSNGDVYRLWVPQDLAFDGAEGKPKGMLVFDIELISHLAPVPPQFRKK